MSKIDTLLQNYHKHVRIPWRSDAAPMQRVWFCVYDPKDEKTLRAKLEEFELATIQRSKKWLQYDLSDSFAQWLSAHEMAKDYFLNPELISDIMPEYEDYIVDSFYSFVLKTSDQLDTVCAIYGLGALFGFIKAKGLIEKIAPFVSGRLVVFFPGTFENNNYRLLDGYDGWSYLAIPITSDN
ncbi:MAG: DUF1788 domain-containing protein [Clostridia bacterium]|nr:DUF1788 domain-containing protein [Clostridia bacterium]